jgi:hypothetical protein
MAIFASPYVHRHMCIAIWACALSARFFVGAWRALLSAHANNISADLPAYASELAYANRRAFGYPLKKLRFSFAK